MGGELTYWCEGCKHVSEDFECSKYDDTTWVDRRRGCFFHVPGTIYTGGAAPKKSKRAGQQKQGRKIITDLDLTQGGLFPEWNGIGIGWKSVNYKGKKRHVTPGRDKPHGKASQLARYCAKRSRAYKHPLYATQCAKWDKAR